MSVVVASEASDAAENLADSLNRGSITGWDLLAAVLVIVVSVPIARLVGTAIKQALKRAGIASDDAALDIGMVARWLVYLVACAVAASILGVNTGFLSVLFAAALTIGALALRPMVENSASGVVLVARPAFSVGDQIKTKEYRGIVEEIGSRSTRLRLSDGIVVYVSNNQVLGNPILVYTEQDSRRGSFEIGVGSDNDLDHLTSVLMNAITSVDNVVADPAPAVHATGIRDKAAMLEISFWYPSTEETGSTVIDGVIRATLAALRRADIELAVPDAKITEEPASTNDDSASAPSDDHTSDTPAGSDDRS